MHHRAPTGIPGDEGPGRRPQLTPHGIAGETTHHASIAECVASWGPGQFAPCCSLYIQDPLGMFFVGAVRRWRRCKGGSLLVP